MEKEYTLKAPPGMSFVNAFHAIRDFSNGPYKDFLELNPIMKRAANPHIYQLYLEKQCNEVVDSKEKVLSHICKRTYFVEGAGKKFKANFRSFPYITISTEEEDWPSHASASLIFYHQAIAAENKLDPNDSLDASLYGLHPPEDTEELDKEIVPPSDDFIPKLE